MMADALSAFDSEFKSDSYRAFVDDLFNYVMLKHGIIWLNERPTVDETLYDVNIKKAVMKIITGNESAITISFRRSLFDQSTDLEHFCERASKFSFRSKFTEINILTFLALMSCSAVYFHNLKYFNAPEILANLTASILAVNNRRIQQAGLWTSLHILSAVLTARPELRLKGRGHYIKG